MRLVDRLVHILRGMYLQENIRLERAPKEDIRGDLRDAHSVGHDHVKQITPYSERRHL